MKTVIEMAREAGAYEDFAWQGEYFDMSVAALERFAELVRTDEREACAKVCGNLHLEGEDNTGLAADLIRARSQP